MKKIKFILPLIIVIIIIMLIFSVKSTTLNKSAIITQATESVNIDYQGLTMVAEQLIANNTDETSIKANTTYLQELIDTVSNIGGGRVRIPSGTYYFAEAEINGSGMGSHVIKCKDNVTVQGEGIDETNLSKSTILKPYGTSSSKTGGIDMFYFNGYDYRPNGNPKYLENADFKNFIIDGAEVKLNGNYDSSGKGILTLCSRNCDLENIIVKNTIATGIGIDLPINCTIKNSKTINCGRAVTSKDNTGGSGFGIGTGFSDEENIHISNCVAEGNGKFGFFFEHQCRFSSETTRYPATRGDSFVVSNCTASGNMYDFGSARGNDVTYENCTSNYSYTNPNVTNIAAFQFENRSRRIHVINCKVEQEFIDVNSSRYYYEPVYWALNNVITNGTSKTTFSPDNACTRAQAIELIWRMAERPGNVVFGNGKGYMDENGYIEEDPYEDVKSNSSHADAIRWAKNENIIDSTSSTFLPSTNCTRADFITFLWKYAGAPIVDTKHNFSDVEAGIGYEKAINWAFSKGIIEGTDNGQFSPNASITRGGIVTFLYRYSKSNNNFNITYNLEGGKVATTNPTSYKSGTSKFTLNNPSRVGYTFDGWTGSNYTTAGYLGQNNYTPQKVVTITSNDTGNKTYTANYTANNYIVSFDANGGTGTMENEYFKYDDAPQKLLENAFSKRGYNFRGWNTKKDGTGIQYTDLQFVRNLTETNNKTITLYAQWIHEEHIPVIDKGVKPTCTKTGLTEGKHCEICNLEIIKQEIIEALGHSYKDGACTECGEKELKLEVTSGTYKIENIYISKVQEKTTVKSFKLNLQTNATEIKVYNKDGQVQKDTNIITTGMQIELKYQNETKTFTIAVAGDVNGDGSIKLSDMSIVNRYRLNKRTLDGAYFLAGDINEDGKVNFKDLVKINRFRLHKITEL